MKKEMLTEEIEKFSSEISKREMDLIKISNANEKKNTIKALNDKIIIAKKERWWTNKATLHSPFHAGFLKNLN